MGGHLALEYHNTLHGLGASESQTYSPEYEGASTEYYAQPTGQQPYMDEYEDYPPMQMQYYPGAEATAQVYDGNYGGEGELEHL